MKVGFLIGNMSNTGGTERVLSLVANGLVKRGLEVSVISLWGNGRPGFFLDNSIKCSYLNETYPKGIKCHLRNICSLFRIVKKEHFTILVDVDVILIFYTLPIRLLKRGIKSVSWEHFNFYYVFRKNNRIRRIAMRLAAWTADAFVVLSKEDEGYYRKNLGLKKKLYQIYNPNTYENVVLHGSKQKMVFAAGRLTKAKGFDLLLRSWKLVEDDFPDWKLCIAGDGEEKSPLEQQMRELGLKNVIFIGNVSNIEEYYEKTSLFVLPSRNEGFGMVLIEAMAYGNPVVSFDCKAGPKEIISDGKDGFLVPMGDEVLFAERMQCLMRSEKLRMEMGMHAKEDTKRFGLDGILGHWEELLCTLSER